MTDTISSDQLAKYFSVLEAETNNPRDWGWVEECLNLTRTWHE